MKVLYLTNVPAPYRVAYFNELAKQCELTVVYQRKSSSERDAQWKLDSDGSYEEVFLNGIHTGANSSLSFGIARYLNRSYDAVVICGNASPTEIFAILYCQMKGVPYCIEGDGAFAKDSSFLKKRIKTRLIKKGEVLFSTCREHDRYYLCYGGDPSRIVRYRFTSIRREEILDDILNEDQKKALREKLGIKEDRMILAVGQFIYRKGFDLLLKAVKGIDGVGVYIIGGTPTEEYRRIVEENGLSFVHFKEFLNKEKLKEYYRAADVFVLPTREDIWGLVINEAMANGLAVISTDRCNAALELVKNGMNGFVVPVDSTDALREAILSVLEKTEEMGRSSLEIIRDYSIEEMVKDHMDVFGRWCGGNEKN